MKFKISKRGKKELALAPLFILMGWLMYDFWITYIHSGDFEVLFIFLNISLSLIMLYFFMMGEI